MLSHKFYRWIWLVALIFFAKACLLAFWVTPLWDIPDETCHFAYARDIFSGRGMPVLGKAVVDADIMSHLRGRVTEETPLNWQPQHPPAYHLLSGMIWKMATFVTDDPELLFRAPRIISAIGGALTLVVLYHLLLLVSGNPLASFALASCVGCIPMFSNLASGNNHDTTFTFFASLATYFWAKFLLQGKVVRQAYYAAVWLSIACFTKLTGFVLAVPMLAIMMYELDAPWKQRIQHMLQIGGLWGIFPGMWMLWSYAHYRMFLPTAVDVGVAPLLLQDHPLTVSLRQFLATQPAIDQLLISFFGGWFGWIGTGKGSVCIFSISSFELIYYSIFAMLLAFLASIYMSRNIIARSPVFAQSHVLADLVAQFSAPVAATRIFGYSVMLLGLLAGCYTAHLIVLWFSPGYQFRQIVYGLLSFLAVLGFCSVLRRQSPKARIVTYVWIITSFFISVLIWQIYKTYLLDGQLRGIHGRYFYPLIPLMMIGVVIPTMALLKKYGTHLFVLLALTLAYLELNFYLSEVIPFYLQGVHP